MSTIGYTPGGSPIRAFGAGPLAAALVASPLSSYVDTGSDPGVYYIDHLDHAMNVVQTIRPENPDFTLLTRDAHTITYEISFGAKDIYGAPVVSHDFIPPWAYGWKLRCGSDTIEAGPITSVNTRIGDDFMKVSGVSWAGYWNHRHQPFDARTTHVDDLIIGTPPQGLHYEWLDASLSSDISHIVKALFDSIGATANTLPITYTRGDLGYSIHHYEVSLGDSTMFLPMLQALADFVPGFDFWIDPDTLALNLASPFRFGDTPGILAGGSGGGDVAYSFDDAAILASVLSLEFTNTGPDKTHTLGTGAGSATQTGVSLGTPAGNEAVYWRLDGAFNAGEDTMTPEEVESRTRQDFAYGLQPVHEIPLSVDVGAWESYTSMNFWTTFKPGLAIWIQRDLIMHAIDSPQRIVSMHGHHNNDGNMIVDFGLNQIYDLDPTVGVYEG